MIKTGGKISNYGQRQDPIISNSRGSKSRLSTTLD